jgi:Fe-S oxidoreductase
MASSSYIDAFIPEAKNADMCVDCGECLQKCPVMNMGVEESREEIKRLLAGEQPQRVFDECTFCFSCNSFCPQGLRPYNLIMERMVSMNRENGVAIPEYMDYMMTGKREAGYFTDIYKALPQEDQAILDKWSAPPPSSKDTLFIGCYGRTICNQLENSKALASLPKFGPRLACCGEIPHRFGDYDYFSELVERTCGLLENLDTERLVCYCGSCCNYLGNIWPNYHGVELPYPVISLYEWLWEKYSAGELDIQRKFSKDIAISDSCYTSELGDSYYEAIRGLHEAAGMRTVELANNRYRSLTCGFASGIRNGYDMRQVEIEAKKKLDQILDTGLGEVSVNCPGCWAGIIGAVKLANEDLKVRFAISEILWAFGDDPPKSTKKR